MMFSVGNIVVVNTKHYGSKTGVIIEPWYSEIGVEWLVKPFFHKRNIICSSVDLKLIQNNTTNGEA